MEILIDHAAAGNSHTSVCHSGVGGAAIADLDVDPAFNSDVDSESDISFDDSASDRSDGSDSGSYT